MRVGVERRGRGGGGADRPAVARTPGSPLRRRPPAAPHTRGRPAHPIAAPALLSPPPAGLNRDLPAGGTSSGGGGGGGGATHPPGSGLAYLSEAQRQALHRFAAHHTTEETLDVEKRLLAGESFEAASAAVEGGSGRAGAGGGSGAAKAAGDGRL